MNWFMLKDSLKIQIGNVQTQIQKEGILRESIKTSEGYKNIAIMSILKSEYNE